MRPVRHLATLLVVFILFCGPSLLGQDAFSPSFKPTLQSNPLQGEINIDGQLDDPGWKSAAIADGFAEVDPGDQVKPGVRSLVLLTYDKNKLYIALIAWDDPGRIRSSICE